MAKKQKSPVVVAELGRPETPSETAARKATDSRLYRQRKTVNNLVFSLIVSLGLMLVIVLLAPGLTGGKDTFGDRTVDVAALAAEAEPGAGRPLIAPTVPEAWKAKNATLRQRDGVVYWQIDYTTVDPSTDTEAYAAVVQAFTADGSAVDEKWISQQFEQQAPTGTEQLGDLDWIVYEHPDRNPEASNVLFGAQTEWNGDAVLLYGTDGSTVLRPLAAQIAEDLAALPATGAGADDAAVSSSTSAGE